MEKLYTRKEAAKFLGIGLTTLDEARAKRLISYVQYTENGKVFFCESDLEEFVARNRHVARISKSE